MPDLQTKSFTTLVTEQATAIQGGSRALVDFTVGSILRAVVEAYAAVALWLQGLILKVLATTRAATSTGPDLDTWFADYGFVRLGAAFATGQATFSRFTATAQAVVPIGVTVQTADGSQQYAVVVDTGNAAYSAALGGYVIAAGLPSVTVPIQALVPGAAGNAVIGGVNTLAQAIAGVDTVTNGAALANGSDAETDVKARARFVEYIASLSKATKGAVAYAIDSVETNISFTLVENQNLDGSPHVGFFHVVIDDGSGTPSSALIATVYAAIDAVRPVAVTFAVYAPTVITANVAMTTVLAAGYDPIATPAAVAAAITNYLNSIPLGVSLSWSRMFQVAYDASPGVIDVTSLTVNGAMSDIAATTSQVIRAGTVAVA